MAYLVRKGIPNFGLGHRSTNQFAGIQRTRPPPSFLYNYAYSSVICACQSRRQRDPHETQLRAPKITYVWPSETNLVKRCALHARG